VADSGDTTGVGLGFGGDLRSPFATTCEAVRADDALGTGAPITTSSTTSGSAANTSHGGAGRKPAVARNTVNAAMCNRTDVIIATTSSNTDHGRVAATARPRGAFFGVGRVVMSPRHGVVSPGGASSLPFGCDRRWLAQRVASHRSRACRWSLAPRFSSPPHPE